MTMANPRNMFGSLFGMVSSGATAVASTFEAGIAGVSMLDRFVQDAKQRQDERSIVDMADFRSRLLEEKSREVSDRQVQVEDFMKKSPLHATLYKANYQRFEDLLAQHDARKPKSS